MTRDTSRDASPVTIVSADTHAGAPAEHYRAYLPSRHHEALDEMVEEEAHHLKANRQRVTFPPEELAIIDDQEAIRSGGVTGAWDRDRRLAEMDREGVAAAIVIAGHQDAMVPFFTQQLQPWSAELRQAGVEAYHRWMADTLLDSGGRMLGVADPGPCIDLERTLGELRWAAGHGFVSVGVPGIVGDPELEPVFHPRYEPFWAFCAENGLSLSLHAGWGAEQGAFQKFMAAFEQQFGVEVGLSDEEKEAALLQELKTSPVSPVRLGLGPRRAMWQLMMSGVFDRYPELQLVLTEIRADWVPGTLAALEREFDRAEPRCALRPREYWERNCWVAPSSIHPAEVEIRHEIGLGRMMFGTDYPHPEGTWPNTIAWIRDAFVGVPEAEFRAILGENALQCYPFDRGAVEAAAARIGPDLDDVLVTRPGVSDALKAHFDKRAGYLRPVEATDVETLAAEVAADLVVVGG